MKIKNTIALILILLAFACSKGPKGLSQLEASEAEQGEYTINSGDTLKVEVWGEPKLSGPVFVRDDGKFTLPLVNDINATNRTLKQVGDEVTTKLKEFIPAASVSVSVIQSAPIRYFLSGSFVRPGEFRSDSKITFLQAIATGQGFAPFADDGNIILIRKSVEGETRYKLNYTKVIEGAQPNPTLRDGDVIAVK